MANMNWTDLTEIAPKLYLSAVTAISDEKLAKHNITIIINASKELPMFPALDAKSVRVPVTDNLDQKLYPYFLVS